MHPATEPRTRSPHDAAIRHWFEVEIGGVYLAKVGGVLRHIRIDQLVKFRGPKGKLEPGFYATNLATGRLVRVRRATRLRERIR